jgi:diguanylate cyclase (GGDEF)-like protein/PAS domain S-box-containing protein
MRSAKRRGVGDQGESELRERVARLEQENARLADSEERLKILFEDAPDGYYLSDLKGTFVDGNSAAEQVTGYRRDELIGKSFLSLRLLVSADLLRAASLLARNLLGHSTGPDEFVLTRRDGSTVPVEIRTHPVRIGGRRLVLGIARDISARKRTERDLRERAKELRALFGLSEIAEREGISLDGVCKALADALPSSWRHEEVACARIVIGGREFRTANFADTPWTLSVPVRVGGAALGWIEVGYLEARPDEDEGPFLKEERQLIDALAERLGRIAERKHIEKALERSLSLLSQSQEIAHVGSWELDVDADRLVWSDEVYRIHGLEPQSTVPTYSAFLDTIHPDDRAAVDAAHAASLREGRDAYSEEHRVVRPLTGEVRYVHEECVHERAVDGRVVRSVGIVQDVTERWQAEAYRSMAVAILEILNEPEPLHRSIRRILATVKARTGVDAVGVRLEDGDDFPYLAQEGFSEDFLLTENTLVERGTDGGVCRDKNGNISLECTCGLVVSGKTDPSNPLFTRGGSAWTNDSLPLLDVPADQDPRNHPRNRCIHAGYASAALVPIRARGKIVGLLQLNDRRKGFFSLAVIELLEGIAAHIGEAMVRKQFEEDLARMARHDPLTGALNRYALDELLEREASRSKRYTRPIGLLMIDINRFKEINDRFGHAMGDRVLQAMAEVLQKSLRGSDILVRYGGDEFLAVLPETDGETAVVKTRILDEVARRNEANPLLDFPVTLAIGTYHWSPGSGQTIDQALAEADRLMYEDKRGAAAPTP